MFGLKKRTWIIGGILVALLGTGAMAAKWHNHTPEERAAWATERVADRLDLNDTQKAAFKSVADVYAEMRGTRPEFMMDLSSKLKELSKDETLTVEEVNVLRDQIKAEFDKRANAIIPQFVDFYNTLNAEQRDMVTAKLEKMSYRMHQRRHMKDGKSHGSHGRWGKWFDSDD